jgi:hypothetical protein
MLKKQKKKWRRKMSKREKCRKCGATLNHDKTLDQYDPEYCSGKCRKEDGMEPYVKSAKEQAAVVEVVKKKKPASLEDYLKNVPSKYARRFQPEKLNWSKNKMNEDELKQAGFRANREPIPGDFDFEETVEDTIDGHPEMSTAEVVRSADGTLKPVSEWGLMKAKAKSLNIKIFGKNKGQLAKEIMEKEAENAV